MGKRAAQVKCLNQAPISAAAASPQPRAQRERGAVPRLTPVSLPLTTRAPTGWRRSADVPRAAQEMAEEARRGRSAAPGHQGAAASLSPATGWNRSGRKLGWGRLFRSRAPRGPGGGGVRRRRNAGKQQDGAAGEGRVDYALGAWSVRKGGVEGPVWVLRAGRSRLPPVWEAAWTGPGCGRGLSGHETSGRDPGHPLGLAAPFFTLHSPFCLSPLGVPVLLGERLDQGEANRGLEKCGSRTLRVPAGLEMEPAGKRPSPHPTTPGRFGIFPL